MAGPGFEDRAPLRQVYQPLLYHAGIRRLTMNDLRPVNAPTRELAGWISRLRYPDLPPRTTAVVRLALLDTLGCGVYGHSTPWARTLLQWAKSAAPARGEATVLGEAAP